MIDRAVMPLDDYKNACDNIREKTETTEAIKSGELPEKINDVYQAGQAQGEREMWDNLTNNNTRTSYQHAFMESNFEYIRPPYRLCPTHNYGVAEIFSTAKKLKKVEAAYFDFSKVPFSTNASLGYYCAFYGCKALEEIEDVGLQPNYYSNTFQGCTNLKKIVCMRVNENALFRNSFHYCSALEDITFEGVIGQNGINLSWSTKLTYDSCHSIFTHLKDFREVIADKVAIPSDTNGYAFADYTLIAGQKYSGTYINKAYGSTHFSGTPQNVEVPIVGQRLAVVFEMIDPMGTAHEVYIYNNNGNLCIFDTFDQVIDAEISIFTITENRTITMPTSVRDNGNATPEDIAEATERGWTIVWS